MINLDSFPFNSYQKGKKKGLFLYCGKLVSLLSLDFTIMYIFYMGLSGGYFGLNCSGKKGHT